jgi:uncharacterized phage-associated protein
MLSAHDVAAYILERQSPISAMKLQKLVYYSQAWSLVWDDRLLFQEPIEAWANGPVVRELYDSHRGQFTVDAWPNGRAERLDPQARATVDAVLGFYGNRDAAFLSELTHRERPWQTARAGIPHGARSTAVITPQSMKDYYGNL